MRTKRNPRRLPDFGSNPYLVGKRYGPPQFWAARGKKFIADGSFSSDEDATYPANNFNAALFYTQPNLIPSIEDKIKSSEELSGDTTKRDNQDLEAVADDTEPQSDNPEGIPGARPFNMNLNPLSTYPLGGDKSKFWMSRGRRSFSGLGNPNYQPPLDRLAQMVGDSELDDTNYRFANFKSNFKGSPGLSQAFGLLKRQYEPNIPEFWIARGKKSFEVAAPVSKRGSGRSKILSRLNSRGLKVPNFWANRGRKNFWAARG